MSSLVHSTKRWLVALTAALAMVSAVAGTALAAPADGKTADTAMPITVSTTPAPVAGDILGNSGGAFEYYSFPYSGNGALQTITIVTNTDNEDIANAVGVSLWLNGNEIGSFNSLGAQPGSSSLTFASDDSGQVLLQVYNYSGGANVSFTVSVAPDSGS